MGFLPVLAWFQTSSYTIDAVVAAGGSNDVDCASQFDEIAADRERHLFIISTDPCMAATKFVF